MPTVSLSALGANGKAHNWNHVLQIRNELLAILNTTRLDYLNIQTNGLRTSNLRSHANAEAGRIKVRNDTGGTLSANVLVYFSGTYSDGTDNYPTVAKAVTTTDRTTTKYACAVVDADIANNADGTVVALKEVSSLDTSGLTVGQPMLLSMTAGGYVEQLSDLSASDYSVQVVGVVTVVHASTGRICFGGWQMVPWSYAQECVV